MIDIIEHGKGYGVGANMNEFFGDGSDGVLNLKTIDTFKITAEGTNVIGSIQNLLLDNDETYTSYVASSSAFIKLDFDEIVVNGTIRLKGCLVTSGTATMYLYGTDEEYKNGVILSSVAVSTTPTDLAFSMGTNGYRYYYIGINTTKNITAKKIETQSVAQKKVINSVLNGEAVIKQYRSIDMDAGSLLTVDNACKGLILYSQGDVNIRGTINMNKKGGAIPNDTVITMPYNKEGGFGLKSGAGLVETGADGMNTNTSLLNGVTAIYPQKFFTYAGTEIYDSEDGINFYAVANKLPFVPTGMSVEEDGLYIWRAESYTIKYAKLSKDDYSIIWSRTKGAVTNAFYPGQPENVNPIRLVVDKVDPSIMFIVNATNINRGSDDKFAYLSYFKSVDGGETWSAETMFDQSVYAFYGVAEAVSVNGIMTAYITTLRNDGGGYWYVGQHVKSTVGALKTIDSISNGHGTTTSSIATTVIGSGVNWKIISYSAIYANNASNSYNGIVEVSGVGTENPTSTINKTTANIKRLIPVTGSSTYYALVENAGNSQIGLLSSGTFSPSYDINATGLIVTNNVTEYLPIVYKGNKFYYKGQNRKWNTGYTFINTDPLKYYMTSQGSLTLFGGAGGAGGAGSVGSAKGGSGGGGRRFAGGFGGGGGGGGTNFSGANIAGTAGASITTDEFGGAIRGGDTTTSVYGGTEFANGFTNGGGQGGGKGNNTSGEYAGGFICIVARGKVTIESTGRIYANGGNGGQAGAGSTTPGGGGGSGGGCVLILHRGAYSNKGAITVQGGSGGYGYIPGSAGASGTIFTDRI